MIYKNHNALFLLYQLKLKTHFTLEVYKVKWQLSKYIKSQEKKLGLRNSGCHGQTAIDCFTFLCSISFLSVLYNF